MKRVFIIHGWGGYPDEGGLPWLDKRFQESGYMAQRLVMPNPLNPQIKTWVNFLKEAVGIPNEETFFIGHSIGAQAILRYLESLEDDIKVGGAVLLAGWMNLTDEAYEDDEDREIARPWLETPINFSKIKLHTNKIVAIFSDNDPLVPITDSDIFEKELGAKIIIENNKGHFSGSDGVTELPVVLQSILEM